MASSISSSTESTLFDLSCWSIAVQSLALSTGVQRWWSGYGLKIIERGLFGTTPFSEITVLVKNMPKISVFNAWSNFSKFCHRLSIQNVYPYKGIS